MTSRILTTYADIQSCSLLINAVHMAVTVTLGYILRKWVWCTISCTPLYRNVLTWTCMVQNIFYIFGPKHVRHVQLFLGVLSVAVVFLF